MSPSREQPGLTRRSLLGGLAGAGAAGLLAPATGLASALGDRPSVFSHWVGALSGDSGELAAPRPFKLVGVEWASPARARIELRARPRGGVWSPWATASTLGHGPDRPNARALIGDPVWTGPADHVELRSSQPLAGLRLHFVDVSLPGAASTAAAAPLAQPRLDAGPGQPPIIARTAWAGGNAPPSVVPGYGTVRLAFVHHTDSPNSYSSGEVPAMILAMYQFHRFVRGWDDIGYNFVIDLYGRIWEARLGGIDQAVVGAQAGGYNLVSTGVAVIGTFNSLIPSAPAISALEQLLAWKLSLHGVPALGRVTVQVNPADAFYTPFAPGARVSLPRIAGHRDGDSTDCPGNAFYPQLPALRPRINTLAGNPARITLTAPAKPSAASAPVPVSGRLTDLHGAPIAGAPVEVQRFSASPSGPRETTVATATTGADGRWSAAVALKRRALLRALHRPAPAAVSDLVAISVPAAITLKLVTASPLKVSGTVRPSTGTVTLELFAVQPGGHWARLRRRVVTVRHGAFSAVLATSVPGVYGVSAHTAANTVSAAGVSAPVEVSIP